MGKGKNHKKSAKKKPAKTQKEKRQAKIEKRQQKNAPGVFAD